MDTGVLSQVKLLNPWMDSEDYHALLPRNYAERKQSETLLMDEWDQYCTILVGPRQSGKTTLAKALCHRLITQEQRFDGVIYLNCDLLSIRNWLRDIRFISDIRNAFAYKKPIIFIDEVQRLDNPGLLLKAVIDLGLPMKIFASGSSQLELKSKIKEHMTGRKFEAFVLPLSLQERKNQPLEDWLVFGSYPRVVISQEKRMTLRMLYQEYVKKDIIEILKVQKPDILMKLIALMAHASGQVVNEQQLSIDCRCSNSLIRNYLTLLENTYVLSRVSPFVGNKRSELTTRPKYYFIDNGFRNQALEDFSTPDHRQDLGLLVEGAVYQELLKYREQNFYDYGIQFWRTKGGAEVDFVISANNRCLPIEIKFRNFDKPSVPRGFRSFVEAYDASLGIIITKNYLGETVVDSSRVVFIPFDRLVEMFPYIADFLGTG